MTCKPGGGLLLPPGLTFHGRNCAAVPGAAQAAPGLVCITPHRFMDTFGVLLSSNDRQIYLERSGMVTRCRLACEALDKGRSVALLARTREEFSTARALAALFSPEISLADPALVRPAWQQPCLGLPPLSQWQDKASWAARMAALYALSLNRPRVLVVSVESLLLRYMPVNFFHSRTLEIGKGSDYAPELLLEQAVEWGYERVAMVTRPGEMARRGDILDLFPSGYARPVRLEFFGDTLEEMRFFDAETQRSLQGCDELTLLPVSPLSMDAREAEATRMRFDRMFAEGRIGENDCYSFKKPWMPVAPACCRAAPLTPPACLKNGCRKTVCGCCPARPTAPRLCATDALPSRKNWRTRTRPCRNRPRWPCAKARSPHRGTSFNGCTPNLLSWG